VSPALGCRVTAWAAWAPGLETPEAWQHWAEAPAPIGADGVPDVRFLPAMLRRRCTPLTRIMLKAAFECCPETERAGLRSVFASRHGSINESIELLECVARGEKLSPTKFSHTVHNAQAALFSMAAGNRCASSSLSAQQDTFGCAWLEALAHLEREPERGVLLVVGDVPLAETFAPLVDEPVSAWALALRLEAGGEAPTLRLGLEPAESARETPPWPDGPAFLRFWLSDDPACVLEGGRHRWRFARV